jgi:GMP synthase-like glutamine amidotransferase
MRIGLLECDHVDEHNLSVAGDYGDMFASLLRRAAPHVELRHYDVSGAGELPATTDECDAWLCTGSRRSVYDDVDWIRDLAGFVREVHASRSPFVGVCFGHQLIAHALGGRTERSAEGWGVGAHELDLVRREPWMQPVVDRPTLLFMHQDQVRRVPDGSVVLACALHCEIAAFRVGNTMLGIQAHPEFRPGYLAALLDDRLDRIGSEATARARQSLDRPTDDDAVARWIVRFLEQAG